MPGQALVDSLIQVHSKIRRRFPQIERDLYGNKRVYLNSGAGTLMVDSAARLLGEMGQVLNPQPGSIDPAEIATEQLHWRVRQSVADFFNSRSPDEISFHLSTTHALFGLAYGLRALLTGENNVVVTDLDHMANISPWEDFLGSERGCEIRRARVNDEGCLDADHLVSLVDQKTGLVAVTMASNGFGSVVPLTEIIPPIRKKSPACLICVDAVHHALHGPIDVQAIDCDFLALSGYKVFGPMVGVLWGRKHLLDRLRPYRVETNRNNPPHKFELGTLNNAVLVSLEGALGYLVWLCDQLGPQVDQKLLSRREKFRFVMNAIGAYEGRLSQVVLRGFQKLDPKRFRCYGVRDPKRIMTRDPTFAFEVAGKDPCEVKRYLWEEHGFQIADGNHYSAAIYRHLDRDSMCRASFAHYDTLQTADRFVHAVEKLLG